MMKEPHITINDFLSELLSSGMKSSDPFSDLYHQLLLLQEKPERYPLDRYRIPTYCYYPLRTFKPVVFYHPKKRSSIEVNEFYQKLTSSGLFVGAKMNSQLTLLKKAMPGLVSYYLSLVLILGVSARDCATVRAVLALGLTPEQFNDGLSIIKQGVRFDDFNNEVHSPIDCTLFGEFGVESGGGEGCSEHADQWKVCEILLKKGFVPSDNTIFEFAVANHVNCFPLTMSQGGMSVGLAEQILQSNAVDSNYCFIPVCTGLAFVKQISDSMKMDQFMTSYYFDDIAKVIHLVLLRQYISLFYYPRIEAFWLCCLQEKYQVPVEIVMLIVALVQLQLDAKLQSFVGSHYQKPNGLGAKFVSDFRCRIDLAVCAIRGGTEPHIPDVEQSPEWREKFYAIKSLYP